MQTLRDAGARRVVDLGCGEGSLLRALLADPAFTEILGVDVSARALEVGRAAAAPGDRCPSDSATASLSPSRR